MSDQPTAGATDAYTPLPAIMAPVVDHLTTQGFTQAVLIPTGLLGLLPLHAAWTPGTTKPTGRRYALDSVTCRYAPSAMALAASHVQAQQTPADGMLAVDNPDGSLRFSGQEVAAILSYFPDEKQKALRGQNATRQATLDALPAYPVLHFATHG